MTHITLDYTHAKGFFNEQIFQVQASRVNDIHRNLHDRNSDIEGVKGWVHLLHTYNKTEFQKIKQPALNIQENSDALLVIGVDGSYLGAQAAIEMLHHNFYDMLPREERKDPHVIFVGHSHNTSSTYISQVINNFLENKNFSINVISKSGTTTKPTIAFRVFKEILLGKYGNVEAQKRIYKTTDKEKGALRKLAMEEGNESFLFLMTLVVGIRYLPQLRFY